LNLGYVDFSKLDVLILDEADRMLDMGFLGDINRIAEHCSPKRQTLLFSATMPQRIHDLASKMLNDPKTIQIALSKPAEGVIQVAYPVHEDTKPQLLVHLLKDRDLKSVLVFSSRKRSVNIIARSLKKAGVNVGTISSDLEQKDREETLRNFRNRKITVLVATDVVSRGIDIDDIELVINYDVPPNEEDYVHRIGRTARASKSGMAITLIKPDEFRSFSKIEQLIGSEVRKLPMPAELGEGPTYDPNYRGSGRGWHGGGGGGRRNSGGGGRHGGGGGRKNGSGSGGNRSRSGGGGGDRNRRGGSAQ
jgi:superfamily II DNA/RNA helicase